MSELPATYQTTISANVVLLCRFLRARGFLLGAREEAKALEALAWLPLENESRFSYGLKTMLAKNHHQYKKFDALYREFWIERSKAADSKESKTTSKTVRERTEVQKRQSQFELLKNWLNLASSEDLKAVPSFSNLEVLSRKNFSELNEEEMKLMMRLLKKLAVKITRQKSRLRKKSLKTRKLDLRRTIAVNLRKGTGIREFVFSEPKEKKLKIVLLCDVSRSMELYSRFFIYLVYAFQNAHDRIETFVFSTALHRVSDELENLDFNRAFEAISEKVPQWSGGTKIGSCLQEFTMEYGHGLLDRKTMVFILSDGWDTGDPLAMSAAMQAIHRQSRRVIWLNPLAGSSGFSPESMGLKAALPYIDVLAPAHNLESLKRALLLIHSKRNKTAYTNG